MANGVGYLKVSILPGQVGLDVSRAIDAAVAELASCDRLVLDLRGHLGGGLGGLRLMSHLTPGKIPIGYTITRRRAESGYDKSKLPKLDRLPTHLPNFLGVASMVLKYVGRDPSILLVSEGLGPKKWHGRIVILVNEHTVSAGEMVAAFAVTGHDVSPRDSDAVSGRVSQFGGGLRRCSAGTQQPKNLERPSGGLRV